MRFSSPVPCSQTHSLDWQASGRQRCKGGASQVEENVAETRKVGRVSSSHSRNNIIKLLGRMRGINIL